MLTTEKEQANIYSPVVIDNIEIYQELTPSQSVNYVYYLLTQMLDKQTAMFISHGKHVIDLFHLISQYETLEPYSVVMAEEILGEPFHLESIETKYQDSGLLDVLSKRGVPFFRILSRAPSLDGTIRVYSSRVSDILNRCTNSHIFLEIKDDGSVGGILPEGEDNSQLYEDKGDHHMNYVVGYRVNGGRKEDRQVSLSLLSLKRMKMLWVFAFGDEPAKHIKRTVKKTYTCTHEYPATYLRTMPGRVRVFTDQKIV